ncbi:hypothetical protein ACFW91_33900 [Streptomyces asoensis]|uniref:hypothetical protein n=1 Tax=Streptomyces asoensis TaxID=249586 RepID=UPI003677C5A9
MRRTHLVPEVSGGEDADVHELAKPKEQTAAKTKTVAKKQPARKTATGKTRRSV